MGDSVLPSATVIYTSPVNGMQLQQVGEKIQELRDKSCRQNAVVDPLRQFCKVTFKQNASCESQSERRLWWKDAREFGMMTVKP